MKKTMTLCLAALACSCFGMGNKQPATNVIRHETDCPGDSTAVSTALDYERLISYFADLRPGVEWDEKGRLLPADLAQALALFPAADERGSANAVIAVGKITGYRGMDLLVCDVDNERPDEDNYDNHVSGVRLLLAFRGGKPIALKGSYSERPFAYEFDSDYTGEGGEWQRASRFAADTTIVTTWHSSESESATGYATPIVTDAIFRTRLTPDGAMEVVEVTRLEFSSQFFDRQYLDENDKAWGKDDADGSRDYPAKKEKWRLELINDLPEGSPQPLEGITLYFYNERQNGKLTAVFESYLDGKLADRYTLGQQFTAKPAAEARPDSGILKCPVTIKTSDGVVEITPEGKFRRL